MTRSPAALRSMASIRNSTPAGLPAEGEPPPTVPGWRRRGVAERQQGVGAGDHVAQTPAVEADDVDVARGDHPHRA